MKDKDFVPNTVPSPFALMRRLSTEIERMFDEFDFRLPLAPVPVRREFEWLPAIEVFQKDKEFIVRAELPGLTQKDVTIEITPEYLTIAGERKQEKEEKREGFLRTERSYGKFFRSIALPEEARTEAAKATFKAGVLEIGIPVTEKKPVSRRVLPVEEQIEKKELVGA